MKKIAKKKDGTGFVFTQDVIDRIAIGFYQNGQQAPLYDSGFDNPNGQMYASTNDVAKLLSLMVIKFLFFFSKTQISKVL